MPEFAEAGFELGDFLAAQGIDGQAAEVVPEDISRIRQQLAPGGGDNGEALARVALAPLGHHQPDLFERFQRPRDGRGGEADAIGEVNPR